MAMPRHVGSRLRTLATFGNQLLNGSGSDVVDHERTAAFENILRNNAADGTEPDKADPFHFSTPYIL